MLDERVYKSNNIDKIETGNKIDNKIIEASDSSYYTIERDESDFEYEQFDKICEEANRLKYFLESKASLAEMGETVESTKQRPIIGTMALDTCYGILLYDRKNKWGIVGHGAPSSKDAMLKAMLARVNDGTKREIEYLIVPGFRNVDYRDFSGSDQLMNIINLCKFPNIKLVPLSTLPEVKLHTNTLSYEFAFDTQSGEFVTNFLFFDECEVNPRFIPKNGKRF